MKRWTLALLVSTLLHASIYLVYLHQSARPITPRKIETGSPITFSIHQFKVAEQVAPKKEPPKPSAKKITPTPTQIKKPTPKPQLAKTNIKKSAPTVKPEPTKPAPKPTLTPKKSEVKPAPTPVTEYAANGLPIMSNPAYLSKIPPIYPRRSIQRKQEGKVILDATVDIKGLVEDVQVFRSSGHKALDKSALRAIKKWKFQPPKMKAGIDRVVFRIPVNFQLEIKRVKS